jgi:hypothetical protein
MMHPDLAILVLLGGLLYLMTSARPGTGSRC